MTDRESFFNLYRHDFVRVAVAVPPVRVADPAFNASQTVELVRDAASRKALVVVFPKLGLSAYSCEDLFQQQALLDGCIGGLNEVVQRARDLPIVALVGLPLRVEGLLYNCAAVVHRGRVAGVIPKTYLPNYREFYEMRQFAAGDSCQSDRISLLGDTDIPFGANLLFEIEQQPLFVFHVEICEDLWVPIPPFRTRRWRVPQC